MLRQSCLTLCNPLYCSLTGSSVHGISQARKLEWVAISFSRWSSWPRDQNGVSSVSCISRQAGGFFTTSAALEALIFFYLFDCAGSLLLRGLFSSRSEWGSSLCRISQVRMLERVAISFSRWSSWPRDQTRVCCIAGGFFTAEQLQEALVWHLGNKKGWSMRT